MCGGSRESATPAVVTGPVLIPCGRRQVCPSLPPPRLCGVGALLPEAARTPHKDDGRAPPPPATPTFPQAPVRSAALQVCPPHAAGLDIGAAEPGGAVPPGGAPPPVRRVGPCPAALDALADRRMACGVPPVARASTGVSWIPRFALLETRGIQGLLLAPRHATRAPGRPQTARLACQWRPRLHASGLLAGAFRPAEQVCVLRSSVRHRQRLRTAAAHPRQPRHKAWPQRHRTLPQVVRNLTGGPGGASSTRAWRARAIPGPGPRCVPPMASLMRARAPKRARAPLCLTASRRPVSLLAPTRGPGRSAAPSPAGDLRRPKRWAALAPPQPADTTRPTPRGARPAPRARGRRAST